MFTPLRNWPHGQLGSLPLDLLRSSFVAAESGAFDEVRSFCVFLGHSRSGHSLLAALLDAHRNVVLADELRVLKHVAAGFPPSAVYKLILRNAVDISAQGRARAGYRFQVPGEWQGRYERIQVVGDKDGSWTASLALRNFSIIEALFRRVPVPVRVVHLYRNPYDVISTIYRRYRDAGNAGGLPHAINYYFRRAEGVEIVRRFAGAEAVIDLSHEQLIAEPKQVLPQACRFLTVDAPSGYLDSCAGIVFASPRKTRDDVDWSKSHIAEVAERKARYDYLAPYSHDR